MKRLPRRLTFLYSALVGLMAGLLAVLFQVCVEGLESGQQRLFHTPPGPLAGLAVLGAGLGALACWLTQRFAPQASGSGIPHVKQVLAGLKPPPGVGLMMVKLGAGLLALAAGMSLGREGPTIHLGAACGALLAARLPTPTRYNLIAAGAGAGLAAAFNAPLAGFVFVMEELRREMSRYTYGSALICSVTAVAVARLCLGQGSAFGLADGQPIPLQHLPLVAMVGLAGGLLGVAFNVTLLKSLRMPVARPWLGALAGLVGVYLLAYWPAVPGGGHNFSHHLLLGQGGSAVGPLLAVLLAKLCYTVLCYASGVPGGIFAPILTLGALLGYAAGLLSGGLANPALLATVGMAAVLTGSVRAPLTGVVLIGEMTGEYHLLYALLMASFLAYCVAEWLRNPPIYEALLGPGGHSDPPDEMRLVEVLVEADSPLSGRSLGQLSWDQDLLVALIERDGQKLFPHATTQLQGGDMVTLLVGPALDESKLTRFLDQARLD